MNYLAHSLLTNAHPEEQLGSLYADFVRGTLRNLSKHYNPRILSGIAQHRSVDQFTDQHPLVLESRAMLPDNYRRYSGIVLDVLYDYFLHQHWNEFSNESKVIFIRKVYQLLEYHSQTHPERLQGIVNRMLRDDWLGSYADLQVIDHVLKRISKRFKRENPLANGLIELDCYLPRLEDLFLQFFPEVQAYADALSRHPFSIPGSLK